VEPYRDCSSSAHQDQYLRLGTEYEIYDFSIRMARSRIGCNRLRWSSDWIRNFPIRFSFGEAKPASTMRTTWKDGILTFRLSLRHLPLPLDLAVCLRNRVDFEGQYPFSRRRVR
jgi:hypothetical protein